MYHMDLPLPLFYAGLGITIILGLGWGSFATMATYRLPRSMPWIGDKPRCFACKTPLTILDYFSIISYFVHRGKCRHCGDEYEEDIGYFITELGITLLLVLSYLKYGFSDYFVLTNAVIVGGTIMAVIDAQHRFIPSKVLISMFTLGILYRTFIDGTFYGVVFGASLGLLLGVTIRYIYFWLLKQPKIGSDFTRWQHEDRFKGPGFDYVKLLGIIGTWLPYQSFFALLVAYGSVIILWRLLHPSSLRIGTMLTIGLIQLVLFPIN